MKENEFYSEESESEKGAKKSLNVNAPSFA